MVLSACDTAPGIQRGDTVMALPLGILVCGADSVVASLWKVDDRAKALLMARFLPTGWPGPNQNERSMESPVKWVSRCPNSHRSARRSGGCNPLLPKKPPASTAQQSKSSRTTPAEVPFLARRQSRARLQATTSTHFSTPTTGRHSYYTAARNRRRELCLAPTPGRRRRCEAASPSAQLNCLRALRAVSCWSALERLGSAW